MQAQADLCKYLGIDDPELMPRSARRSFIVTSPTVSPVARDSRDKALKRRSDITDHRMRGSGLSNQLQACMKNEVRVFSSSPWSLDRASDEPSVQSDALLTAVTLVDS